jgi:hypothetical protein
MNPKTMTNDNSSNIQLNELISFVQHAIPGLTDGKYNLHLSAEVKNEGSKKVSDDSLSADYTFGVTGDRFSLKKPAEAIYSVFPPANASGKYNAVLPHVVFTRPSFPWSRYPDKTLSEVYSKITGNPGQDSDEDIPTWLTVLLLDEDDVAAYAGAFPAFSLAPANATIADLFSSSANPKSSLGTNYGYFYGVKDNSKPMESYMDPGDKPDDAIRVLDIPLPLFWNIAPTIGDLKLMAHVRTVSLINKPTMKGISDIGEPEGSFSIVFGNRLPGEMKKTYAYLVSLEQMEEFLPTSEDGGMPAGDETFHPDPAKMLRLAVLSSWNFYSLADGASAFPDRLSALNQASGTSKDHFNEDLKANTSLRLIPSPAALPIVKNALNMGYIPLNHQLRSATQDGQHFTADKTVSWYRGPLLPYINGDARIKLPVTDPGQASIFDPTTGMLDVSYAAAWTLGRQMALQDTHFSVPLYNWKKGLSRDLINDLEEQMLMKAFGQAPSVVTAGGTLLTTEETPRPRAKPGSRVLHTISSLSPKTIKS